MLIPRRQAAGFSLVELMVALAVGLILIGSVLGLVVSNVHNNNVVVRGMRVTQESRAVTEIMTRELRRVRYTGNALSRIGSGSTVATFGTVDTATSGCIKYSYDADGDGAADAGEFRMFARDVVSGRGVLRYGEFANAAAVSCTGGDIISSTDTDLTCLQFVMPTGTAATAIDTDDAVTCFSPVPSPTVSLTAVEPGSIYFALRLSMTAGPNETTARRTDGRIMIRSPAVGP